MVELEYHPGIVELPRRHKWKQGVMLNQSVDPAFLAIMRFPLKRRDSFFYFF